METSDGQAPALRAHLAVIFGKALAAIVCGAIFLFALFRQFSLVEVAASLATGAEVFSSAPQSGTSWKTNPNPTACVFFPPSVRRPQLFFTF